MLCFKNYPLNNFFNGYVCLHCAPDGKAAKCFERFEGACGDELKMKVMWNWIRSRESGGGASGVGEVPMDAKRGLSEMDLKGGSFVDGSRKESSSVGSNGAAVDSKKRCVIEERSGDSDARLPADGYRGRSGGADFLEDAGRIPSEATKQRYANIMMDYWFKRTFGMPERSRLLLLLLKELIPEREIKGITYLPTEHENPLPEMKDVRIDVECTDERGARFIVEMQVCKQDFFRERMLFYSSYALLGQMMKGKRLGKRMGRRKASRLMRDLSIRELRDRAISSGEVNHSFYNYPPVYMVSLLNFSIHPESEDVLYRYELYDRRHEELMTDRLNFIFLEMPNCKRALTEKATLLDNFCYAMRQMQFLDNRPPQLKAEIFELLFESANISKFTAKEKLKYETDMTTERDRINQLATSFLDGERQGMEKGMEKGIEKGKTEEKMETAKNFLKLGVSIDVVSKATGLSVEDVKKLQ